MPHPLADELRAALHWTVTGGHARAGLAVAGLLDQWWPERGLAREGRRWLTRLYERMAVTGEHVPDAELAAAYHAHARFAGIDGGSGDEREYSRRAEEAARRCGDRALLARVLAGHGLATRNPADAERACRDAIAWAAPEGVCGDALPAVYTLAQLLWRRGELDEAADLLAAARPVEAARPAVRGRRTVDMILGLVALSRGDLVAAHDHLVVALRAQIAHGYHAAAAETLGAMAVRCGLGGELHVAALLFGAAQAARARLRVTAESWGEQQAAVRSALGDAVFDEAYGTGAGRTLAEAAAQALAVEHPDLALDSDRFSDLDTRSV